MLARCWFCAGQAEDLRTLLRRYMEWAYQLFPNLAFEDFLPTLQKLSGKARVRRAIEDLREKQRQRYLVRAPTAPRRPATGGLGSASPAAAH